MRAALIKRLDRTIVLLALAGLQLAASACQTATITPAGLQTPGDLATTTIQSALASSPPAPIATPAIPTPTATARRATPPPLALTPTPTLSDATLREGRPLPETLPLSTENLDEAGLLAVWGQGIPTTLGYSPDGKFFGMESAAGQYLYDAENYSRVAIDPLTWQAIFPPPAALLHEREGTEWALILDGQAAAYTQPNSPLAVSLDRSLAAAVGSDGKVGVWDISTGDERASFRPALPGGEPGSCRAVTGLAFSPDGRTLAVGCDLGGVLLVDSANGSLKMHPPSELFNAGPLVFSAGGMLAVGFSDLVENGSAVLVWEASSGRQIQRLDAPELTGGWELTTLAFSPDGKALAAGYQSGPVLVWDMASGEVGRVLHGFAPSGSDLEFSPDGLWLADTAYGETQLRTPVDGQVVHRLTNPEIQSEQGEALKLAFSPGGQVIATSRWPGISDIWRLPAAEFIRSLPARCCFNRFDHDGARLGVLGEGSLQFYRIGGWQTAASLEAPTDLADFAISPVEDWVVFGEPGALVVKDSRSGRQVRTIELDEDISQNTPDKIEYAPNGLQIAFRLGDQVIVMRSPEWETIHIIDAPGITDLAYSPDGALLAAAGEAGVLVWDALTGNRLASYGSGGAALDSLAFSPDGALLAGASGEKGVVLVWGVK